MNEINKMRNSFRDDIERKYIDLLEYKRNREIEMEELNETLG